MKAPEYDKKFEADDDVMDQLGGFGARRPGLTMGLAEKLGLH